MFGLDPIYVMSLGMVGVVLAVSAMIFLMYQMWSTLKDILSGTVGIHENTGKLSVPQSTISPVEQNGNRRMVRIESQLNELAALDIMLYPKQAQQLVSSIAFNAEKLQEEIEDMTTTDAGATVYGQSIQPTVAARATVGGLRGA